MGVHDLVRCLNQTWWQLQSHFIFNAESVHAFIKESFKDSVVGTIDPLALDHAMRTALYLLWYFLKSPRKTLRVPELQGET